MAECQYKGEKYLAISTMGEFSASKLQLDADENPARLITPPENDRDLMVNDLGRTKVTASPIKSQCLRMKPS